MLELQKGRDCLRRSSYQRACAILASGRLPLILRRLWLACVFRLAVNAGD